MNLQVNGILKTTRHWLLKNNKSETTITQMLNIIETILQQNFFQYKDGFFNPRKHSNGVTYIRNYGRYISKIFRSNAHKTMVGKG